MSCCAGCTCGQPEPAPVVDAEILTESNTITEGWQMTGLASGRKQLGHARRDVPILRPIESPVEWGVRELHQGIRVIELCIDAETPTDGYVKVLGAAPQVVYDTWQRVARMAANAGWIHEDPF